ncbi:MAG: hypothetical protein IPG45_13735 [Deltaproteobacteria bacterium]|nr:hypothetical protein [Deltaproteobacteria bacterium]
MIRRTLGVWVFGLSAIGSIGCGGDCLSEDPAGVHVHFDDPQAPLEGFLSHPFPADGLMKPSGLIRLDHFPNPTESSTLKDYLGVFSAEIRGFSVTSGLYLAFSGPVDPGSFPSDPSAALSEGAPVELIDVDPSSPERGRRFPLRLRYRDEASLYLPAHHLIALPPFGATLRGGTRYALLLNEEVRTPSGEPVVTTQRLRNLLAKGCPDPGPSRLSEAFQPLAKLLDEQGRSPKEIVGATVFTTQQPVEEMRALVEVAKAQPVPNARNFAKYQRQARFSDRYLAELELPGFQSGQIPFRSLGDGGAFRRDADGKVMVDHQETTRIGISIPADQTMPADGWPVVLYSHGTGGSYQSTYDDEVSDRLGRVGIAVIGYDQTLHGPRDPTGSDPNLTFFNLFNPIAARDNVRQGAADLAVLAQVIDQLVVPAEVAGQAHHFDVNRMGFLGHSQGSLVGAPFMAADTTMKAAVYSGLGAILSITLQERKDIVDFSALLSSLLQFPEGEVLDDFHPVLTLIQTFIEPADPIAYARTHYEAPPGGLLRDYLMVEGFLDFASPARGQEAFATAAHFPVVAPVHRLPEAAVWLGPAAQEAPATDNVMGAGGPVTAGLIQYPEETHFPIFDNGDANRRYVEFLRSALIDGQATIPPSQ